MKLYKVSLIIIMILGIIFIGNSDPMKNLYKNSASIITGLKIDDKSKNSTKKEDTKEKEKAEGHTIIQKGRKNVR